MDSSLSGGHAQPPLLHFDKVAAMHSAFPGSGSGSISGSRVWVRVRVWALCSSFFWGGSVRSRVRVRVGYLVLGMQISDLSCPSAHLHDKPDTFLAQHASFGCEFQIEDHVTDMVICGRQPVWRMHNFEIIATCQSSKWSRRCLHPSVGLAS